MRTGKPVEYATWEEDFSLWTAVWYFTRNIVLSKYWICFQIYFLMKTEIILRAQFPALL